MTNPPGHSWQGHNGPPAPSGPPWGSQQTPASSPHPHQPYGNQTYGHPHQPQHGQPPYQTTAHGAGAPTAAPPRKRRRLVIGLVAGGVALLMIALGAVWVLVIATPEKAVMDYLSAIRDGDAQRAISLAKTTPKDARLLTDEVLAKNKEVAPISDVRHISTRHNKVTVSYTMGETPITETYMVDRVGLGWKVYDAAASFSSGKDRSKINFTMNGFAVSDNIPDLFPGLYTLEQDNPLLTFPEDQVLVTAGLTVNIDPSTFTLSHNEAGVTAMRTELEAQLAKCTSVKSVAPENCRLVYEPPPGATVDTETIRWSLPRNMAQRWQPETKNNPAEVSGTILTVAEIRAEIVIAGRRQEVQHRFPIAYTPTFDLTSGKAVLTAW
ncbi:hypothetical protein ACQBAR_01900 [Propionibacteriaceae bacterium Y1685]